MAKGSFRGFARGFYFKLAWNNIRRAKEIYLPYLTATAIIGGVYFLVTGLVFSQGLTNVPSGETARAVFALGLVMYSIFSFGFMIYINNFLIKRRRREFGLYGVLGLSKGHVSRVLLWENLLLLGLGLAAGILVMLVFGKLLFMLLMNFIHGAPDSRFIISPLAYVSTGILFALIFAATSLYNLAQVRLANPIVLLQSEKRGEKESRLVIPLTLFGTAALGFSYYMAAVIDHPGLAVGIFFPLVILVILATYALFTAGSIAVLRLLRKNKRIYYKQSNFVAISGMFHRMKQNAAGLATICILSTMLIVTVSGTLSLYLCQEETLRSGHPYDVRIAFSGDADEELLRRLDAHLGEVAGDLGLDIEVDESKALSWDSELGKQQEALIRQLDEKGESFGKDLTDKVLYHEKERLANSLMLDGSLYLDLDGPEEACLEFVPAVTKQWRDSPKGEGEPLGFSSYEIFSARQQSYGLYGGLLFLGAFFGILFLVVTVLIIYFKQIAEGYEDKERFAILQKVGMDEKQVKAAINCQVRWVFFLPLGAAFLHMAFAGKMLPVMLAAFRLYNAPVVYACSAGVCGVFALIYLLVYRMTARVYYRIVRW